MSESKPHDRIESAVSYARELSETSRTLLGLSSLGVGFAISLLKDASPYPGRPALAIALGLFLCSTMLWLAWGTCRITFKDPQKTPAMLYRYIDFEMAPQKL